MSKELFESLGKIVYYPNGAGGKFIINSLGLSRHSVLHDANFALWDTMQIIYDEDYYNRKLEIVLTTVPDSSDNRDWLKYELGVPPGAWLTHNCKHITPVLENNRTFFVIAHQSENAEKFLSSYPNMDVIKLTNYTGWFRYSTFKLVDLEKDLENKVAYWKYIDNKEVETNKFNPILVDIDNNNLDEAKMQKVIAGLYARLGFDDFQPDLWRQYYQKYMRAHSKIPL